MLKQPKEQKVCDDNLKRSGQKYFLEMSHNKTTTLIREENIP